MKQRDKIFSLESPKTKEVAIIRRVLALGALASLSVGVGSAVNNVMSEDEPRPTHPVTVEPGDTVDKYAIDVARSIGDHVDYRDIRDEIIENSPAAQDGIINPGDELNIPMTDQEIEQLEKQQNQNGD